MQAKLVPRVGENQQRACHHPAIPPKSITRQPCRQGDRALPRTILLTNIVLAGRSGTEVVTEQLADGLRRRGHEVIVFTPTAGALAQKMRARGHVVVDRPAPVPRRPDIIHAHHTGPAMAALAAHPGVPAIFVSHDATAPFDATPPHPRIRRILAVDERCRARLVADGAPRDAVGLLPNGVDLSRIPPRVLALPARPERAVVLSKHGVHLPAIRTACAAAGIAVEAYGSGPGRITDRPEALFAKADLVFATARSALEAAAAGAGVVVCDARGLAGFLTPARAREWLPWNLGAGILAQPTSEATVAAAIAEWSAAEASAAAALVREANDLEAMLDRIEAIHAEVLGEALVSDPAAEAAAMGAFIAGWVPNFDLQAPWLRLSLAVGGLSATAPLETLPGHVAALAERQAALAMSLGAPQRRRGALGRLRDAAGAVWRSVVPRAIRASLHRWRTGQAP